MSEQCLLVDCANGDHATSPSIYCGQVYDITPHVQAHAGWTSGCATSQLLAILRTLGTDCTDEVSAWLGSGMRQGA